MPADAEVDGFVAAITDAGVQLVGLNFFAGDMPGGDRGLVSWPARSTEFRDNIDVTVGIGERLGCRAFNALYGNRTDDSTPDEQDELAAENLALAARAAQRIGGTVLVEPVSGAPRYPLLTAADALAVIDRARRGRTSRCCCDLYHLAVNGDDVDAAIDAARRAGSGTCRSPTPRAAASPAPGSSTSTRYLRRIAATGYDGWVGLEYKPTGASADAFAWLPRERARRPAEPPTPTTERCFRHDHRRLHRPGHHGRPDGRATWSRPASTWSATTAARSKVDALVAAGGRGADSVAEAVARRRRGHHDGARLPGRRGRDRRRRRRVRQRQAGRAATST